MEIVYHTPASVVLASIENRIEVNKDLTNGPGLIVKHETLYGCVVGSRIMLMKTCMMPGFGHLRQRIFTGNVINCPEGAILTGRFRQPARFYIQYALTALFFAVFCLYQSYQNAWPVGTLALVFGICYAMILIVDLLTGALFYRSKEKQVVEILRNIQTKAKYGN